MTARFSVWSESATRDRKGASEDGSKPIRCAPRKTRPTPPGVFSPDTRVRSPSQSAIQPGALGVRPPCCASGCRQRMVRSCPPRIFRAACPASGKAVRPSSLTDPFGPVSDVAVRLTTNQRRRKTPSRNGHGPIAYPPISRGGRNNQRDDVGPTCRKRRISIPANSPPDPSAAPPKEPTNRDRTTVHTHSRTNIIAARHTDRNPNAPRRSRKLCKTHRC